MATINRQAVDRRPVDLWATPEVLDTLRAYTGVENILTMIETVQSYKE